MKLYYYRFYSRTMGQKLRNQYYYGGFKSHTFRKKGIRSVLERMASWNYAGNMFYPI